MSSQVTTNKSTGVKRRGLDRDTQRRLIRWGAHLVGLFPLAWLVFDYWFGFLGPEPIRAIILRTGKAAIIMLVLSLACTPANIIFGWKWPITVRKPLGLYGFMYVGLHLLAFVWLDYGFQWAPIVEEIARRRYALVGFAAFVLLVPLALTSNKWSMRKLGKKWKPLHKLVYPIAILAVIHYLWLVKQGAYTQPFIFAGLVGLLLFTRIPPVKQFLLQTQRRIRARWQAARTPAA